MLKKTLKTITVSILSALTLLMSFPSYVYAEDGGDEINLFEITLSEATNKQTVKSTVFKFLTDYESLAEREYAAIDTATNVQELSGADKDKLVSDLESILADMRRLYLRSSDIISLAKMLSICEAHNKPYQSETLYLIESVEYVRDKLLTDSVTITALLSAYTDGKADLNALKVVLAEKTAAELSLAGAQEELDHINIQISLYSARLNELTTYVEDHRFDIPTDNPFEEVADAESAEGAQEETNDAQEDEDEYVPSESGVVLPGITVETIQGENLSSDELLSRISSLSQERNIKKQTIAELVTCIEGLNKKIEDIAGGVELSDPIDITAAVSAEKPITEDTSAVAVTEVVPDASDAESGSFDIAPYLNYIIYGATGLACVIIFVIILKKKKSGKKIVSEGSEDASISEDVSADEDVTEEDDPSEESGSDASDEEISEEDIADDEEYDDDEEDI